MNSFRSAASATMNGRLRAVEGCAENPAKQSIPAPTRGRVGDDERDHPGSGQLLVAKRLPLRDKLLLSDSKRR